MTNIKEVKIGYKVYTINEKEQDNSLRKNIQYCGMTDYYDLTITIDKDMRQDLKNETLIHEVMHGIDDMYDIGLTEEQVVALGKGIYTVLVDNPELKLEINKREEC